MSILGRLITSRGHCDSCNELALRQSVALPDRRVWPCERCRREVAHVFSKPLKAKQFKKLLDAMAVSDVGMAGIPWGATRQEVDRAAPDWIRRRFSDGASQALMRSETGFEGIEVAVTFQLETGRLAKCCICPRKAVPKALHWMVLQYGMPVVYTVPGFEMLPHEWQFTGFRIHLDDPPNHVVEVCFACSESDPA